ncbi:putative E3 ubiquitin-protein ligase herc4 [Tritrichomonas musculus]|uniref:E3 ubiquitin-protein ligase herc4 n=1 Tax=Tritrichomonas musculus TaxID=1915356 RepID=A0ABR2KBM2_9EUKA
MVTNKDSTKQNHLYFSHFKIPESPLFLNINGRYPISIYGGFSYAASIDNEGQVILIYPAQIVIDKNAKLDSVSLPDGEKAVSVSCCFEKLLALSSNGKVYESPVSLNKKLSFKQVTEFADIEIIDISGTADHCLALSKEGRVYARGKNNYGQLGLNEEVQDLPKFTSLSSLNDYKIEAVYAGQSHSLFRTSDGKVISCGSNIGCELLDGRDLDESVEDGLVETSIEKGASFCIAGYGISVVFIDCDPPQNMPKNGRFYVIKELKIFGSKSGNFERSKFMKLCACSTIQTSSNLMEFASATTFILHRSFLNIFLSIFQKL